MATVRRPLARRLTLLVLLGAGLILATIVFASAELARTMLERELESRAHAICLSSASRVETVQRSLEKAVQGLSQALLAGPLTQKRIEHVLRQTIANNQEMAGATVALEPGVLTAAAPPLAFHSHQNAPDEPIYVDELASQGWDFTVWDWYSVPKFVGRPLWTDPYFGTMLTATYSVPLFDPARPQRFVGVVAGDLSLTWLTDFLHTLPLGEHGHAFLLSSNGTFLSSPQTSLIMNESIFSVAEELGYGELRALGKQMVAARSGFAFFPHLIDDAASYVAFAPISSTNWSLAVVFPRQQLMAQVFEMTQLQVALGMVGLLVLALVVINISRSIARPLATLVDATHTISSGDFAAALPAPRTGDEIDQLTGAFRSMQHELRRHVAELERTAAAKERIQADLRIARSIQMSLLPKDPPARREFELRALLEPAREVGGDFYDFFLTDEEHLLLVVADAAGKGVPAAIFTAVTSTLLKAFAREVHEPAAILSQVNAELSRGNDACMFVTIFCAAVHLPSGECHYASGGHDLPFVLSPAAPPRRPLPVPGVALGVIKGARYGEGRMVIAPGETLVFFTDGVTEAMSSDGEPFGEARLAEALSAAQTRDSDVLLTQVRQAVRRFAGEAEQNDDITLLAFTYHGPQGAPS